jgi:hypothetical protein
MAKYILISSRDPFTFADVGPFYDLAAGLAKEGNQVSLMLVENGVLPARRSRHSEGLARLAKAGVEILADEFSLRERGIPPGALTEGVRPAPIDLVIDHLAEGRKALWN